MACHKARIPGRRTCGERPRGKGDNPEGNAHGRGKGASREEHRGINESKQSRFVGPKYKAKEMGKRTDCNP